MEYLRNSSSNATKQKKSVTEWMRQNKLTVVGGVWASSIAASLAYNTFCAGTCMKPSLRLIHARIHAQAITLAALSSAAALHAFENKRKDDFGASLPLPCPNITEDFFLCNYME